MKPPETYGGGSWRRPRPTQGCSASKELDMVMVAKRRPEWLGHVVRMDQTRMGKKKFESKPEGKV
jgi:hypothetical protein